MLRKIVFLLTAVSFLLIGIAAFTIAAENPTTTQPSTTVQPSISVKPDVLTKPLFICPSGWQRKPNTADIACVPGPPTPGYCIWQMGEKYFGSHGCVFSYEKQGCIGCLIACRDGNRIRAPNPCPSGWHMKPYPACQNCSVCVPNSPTPINCPAGYNYYEMLECKRGIGTQCVGCEVGCAKPQAPPR